MPTPNETNINKIGNETNKNPIQNETHINQIHNETDIKKDTQPCITLSLMDGTVTTNQILFSPNSQPITTTLTDTRSQPSMKTKSKSLWSSLKKKKQKILKQKL